MDDHPVPREGPVREISDRIRELLAGRLDADPEEIEWGDELTAIGVDSIALMAVLEWFLTVSGVRVPYADAVASRTVAGLGRLLASHGSGSGRGDAGKAPIPGPEQVDDAQPFALSVMSQAYWAGQHLDEGATPVVAHFYHEFDGAALDPRRMERACRLLYERNPMLRAVVTADGAQYVRPLPDDWALPVDDLRDLDETGLAAKLLEIREERAQRNMRPDRGEVFQVGLALLPEERSRTFVKLYMGVGDALSFKMALEQLAALYKDPDGPWDEPRMTYAQYVTAMAAGGDPARELDRQWWLERLDTIHGAPSLPLGDPGAPLHSRRLAHRFTADEWGALRGLAADLGVTPTVLLLTVFGEVIGAWSENRDLVINMPVFRREELHPDVMRIVGDFTGSLLVNLSTGGDGSLAEKVRVNATQVADALGHSHYSGVEVLRDLNRSSAERRTAPIVFTSAIGVGELFGPDFMEVFGPPGWVVSQGPTVLVDCQVSVLGGCLCVNWDVREHVIDDSAVDAMFTTFTTWLASIARDGATSGAPGVPEGQLSVRCDRAMASNRVVEDSGPLFVGGGGCCLHGRFFEVAGADPGRVAVIDARGEHGFGEVAR
ncbi:MAG: condensation domain-containing protein, partial [Propionibacterium acidifaciens]